MLRWNYDKFLSPILRARRLGWGNQVDEGVPEAQGEGTPRPSEIMSAYYNEIEPYAAQWLRNLISAGLIASGDVDTRSITEVQPNDVAGYTQCHFFAGIAGWSLALRMAGWPDCRPVWTGSCPCQPFSVSGSAGRQSDERHLWPDWARLIGKCKPPVIFGEQVDSAIAAGWLDDCFHDLEGEAYACAAAVLPAIGVGSLHERSRLFWVADSSGEGLARPEQQRDGIRSGTASASAKCGDPILRARVRHEPDPVTALRFDGIPRPVGIVRAFGNAIVPQVAAEFVRAYLDCCPASTPATHRKIEARGVSA